MGRLAGLFGCALVALLAMPALAGTIHVASGLDNVDAPPVGGLREAIANAQPGDTIVIDAGVNVRLAGNLEVPAGKDLHIEGPAPSGLKMQATVTQAKPAPTPPAKLVIKSTGTTVRQIAFDGVTVVVDHASATISSCTFDEHLAGPGVVLTGATGGSVGTATEFNTFTNCTQGVESQGSTNVTVTNCHFKKNDTAVLSIDDTNVTVSGNIIKDGDGVVLLGSSGKVDQNKITPDKQVGEGIKVGKSPDSLPSPGKVDVTGNEVKVSGKAKGVVVEGRTDVTIASCDILGKTKAEGILVSNDANAAGGGQFAITGNSVTGCSPAVSLACGAAPQMTCTMTDNTFTSCPGGAVVADCGPNVNFICIGDKADRCGGRGAPFAMSFALDGPASIGPLDILGAKGVGCSVSAGASLVTFDNLTIDGAKGAGVDILDGATAQINTGAFAHIKGPDVAIGETGTLLAQPLLLASEFDDAFGLTPPIDVAPRGWGSAPVTAQFDASGNLVVHVSPTGGVTGGIYVQVFGEAGSVSAFKFVDNFLDARFSPDELPFGAVLRVVSGSQPTTPDPDTMIGETRVKRPKEPAGGGGGANTFTVSDKKVTINSKVGGTGSVEISVTNTTAEVQTLDVGKLTGDWFSFPSGTITLQPGETRKLEVGHSSNKAGTTTVKLVLKHDGVVVAVITCVGVVK